MGADRDDGQPIDRAADIRRRIEFVVQSVQGQRLYEPVSPDSALRGKQDKSYLSEQEIVDAIFVALRQYEPRALYLGIRVEHAGGSASSYQIRYKDRMDNIVRVLTSSPTRTQP